MLVGRGPIGYIFAVLIALYVGWIVFASGPMQRIDRGCQPINWMGNLSVSVMAFVNPAWEKQTKHFFDRTDYVCRYSIWRLAYGTDWVKTHPNDKNGVPQP